MKTENPLAVRSVPALMKQYCIPCIISLVVAALYNIVDQIFIANASYLGSVGNAANTAVYPLTVVALSLAVMIGDGACSFVSISLGKKETDKAADTVGSAVCTVILFSLILTALYLTFSGPILAFFGGTINEATLAASKEYFFWISLGIPFYMFGQCINPIIRSDGAPGKAMAATLMGAFINIVLDPLFIFVFHWGMMGAAVATVIGQIATAACSVWYLGHFRMFSLQKKNFRFHVQLQKKYLFLGMTSFLSQISIVASMAAVQQMMLKYSALDPVFSQAQYAQIPLAVLGIVMKFFQIIISISVGLAAGCIPVAGYNIGAALYKRVRQLFQYLLAGQLLLGLISLLIVEGIPNVLIQLFGASSESVYYTRFAVKCFRIYLCMLPLATLNKGTFIFLQAMGKAFASTMLSLFREIVLGVGLALLLPRFFGLNGVLYSMPLSDLLTFILCAVVIGRTLRELNRDEQNALSLKSPQLKNA